MLEAIRDCKSDLDSDAIVQKVKEKSRPLIDACFHQYPTWEKNAVHKHHHHHEHHKHVNEHDEEYEYDDEDEEGGEIFHSFPQIPSNSWTFRCSR